MSLDRFYTEYLTKWKYNCIYSNGVQHKQRRSEVVTLSAATSDNTSGCCEHRKLYSAVDQIR